MYNMNMLNMNFTFVSYFDGLTIEGVKPLRLDPHMFFIKRCPSQAHRNEVV